MENLTTFTSHFSLSQQRATRPINKFSALSVWARPRTPADFMRPLHERDALRLKGVSTQTESSRVVLRALLGLPAKLLSSCMPVTKGELWL